jgi:hypothetical protein
MLWVLNCMLTHGSWVIAGVILHPLHMCTTHSGVILQTHACLSVATRCGRMSWVYHQECPVNASQMPATHVCGGRAHIGGCSHNRARVFFSTCPIVSTRASKQNVCDTVHDTRSHTSWPCGHCAPCHPYTLCGVDFGCAPASWTRFY